MVSEEDHNASAQFMNLFDDPKTSRFIKKESRAGRDFEVLALSGKRKLEKFPHAKYAVKMILNVHSESDPVTMYFISNSTHADRVLDLIHYHKFDIQKIDVHKAFRSENLFLDGFTPAISCPSTSCFTCGQRLLAQNINALKFI